MVPAQKKEKIFLKNKRHRLPHPKGFAMMTLKKNKQKNRQC
jgi:hypothetical protein